MPLRDPPDQIRSDSGAEFAPAAFRKRFKLTAVNTLFVEPGSPSENDCNESFNGKLRDELLNTENFYMLKKA